ncbi:Gfo/Idh/MocA family oxidoreductase [Halioxenophilus sp. WMMB6]|uniref:Gfo/Idh/MocA family protein n=1 Tax=Halioxenophilus sp. WMMB6 TaxID=3073815 RepID=UPI00295EBD1C|nr:Gfo/Idh/MocA family oxidoreductase [Halioxenophilus sp. WMMB6]
MVKVALIGAGKMGLSHFAIISAHPEVEVVGVCDSAAFLTSAITNQLGVKTFKDAKKMYKESKPDAVIISTPNSTHFELAKEALEAGVHVFLEKPLCLDPQQGKILSEIAARNNLVNQVGYHNRFIGTFQETRRLVEAGCVGEVYHIEGKAYGQVVIRPKTGKTWRSKKSEGGGCLHDYACHVVDLMNYIYKTPSKVRSAQLQSIFSADIEDAVFASFDYDAGVTGYLEANWSDQSYRKMSTTITVYGKKGKIVTDRQELRVYLSPGNTFEELQDGWTSKYITELQKPVNFYMRGEEYSAQLDQFIDGISGRSVAVETNFATATATDHIIESIALLGKG